MEKTLRANGEWAKVTNISRNRNCIAIGYKHEFKAHDTCIVSCSFKIALEIAVIKLID